MNSLILQISATYLHPLLLMISLLVLYRGHNAPGGGFIGGLLAASAYVLWGIAYNLEDARNKLRMDPAILVGTGLLVSLFSGLLSIPEKKPFLTGLWFKISDLKLGTPLLFDIGVYLVVMGILLKITFVLMEE